MGELSRPSARIPITGPQATQLFVELTVREVDGYDTAIVWKFVGGLLLYLEFDDTGQAGFELSIVGGPRHG